MRVMVEYLDMTGVTQSVQMVNGRPGGAPFAVSTPVTDRTITQVKITLGTLDEADLCFTPTPETMPPAGELTPEEREVLTCGGGCPVA